MEGQRVGVRAVVRRGVRRGGRAGGRGLRLPLGLLRVRGLRGRVARGVDEGLFAGVAARRDGRVMRGAGGRGVAVLGGEGAGLLGWGRSLLLGGFRGKQNYYIVIISKWFV